MFRSILVGMDFSRCAGRAAALAAAWAAQRGGQLELVHVLERPLRGIPDGLPWASDEAEAAVAKDIEALLENRLAELRNVVPSAKCTILHGKAHDRIARHAAETGADLVVVGTRGLGMIARELLGSVAERVLRTSPTSVVVVPDDASLARLVPQVVVAPTDFSLASKHGVEQAAKLAREVGARLEIVHAWQRPPLSARDQALADDIAGAAAAELRAEHPVVSGMPPTRHHAYEGAPHAVILDVARDTRADLVAMARSGRGQAGGLLLGSVTDRIVRTSPVPILVFHEGGAR